MPLAMYGISLLEAGSAPTSGITLIILAADGLARLENIALPSRCAHRAFVPINHSGRLDG